MRVRANCSQIPFMVHGPTQRGWTVGESIGKYLNRRHAKVEYCRIKLVRYAGGAGYRLAVEGEPARRRDSARLSLARTGASALPHHKSRHTPRFPHLSSTLFSPPATKLNLHLGIHQVHPNLFEVHRAPVRTTAREPYPVPSICDYRLNEADRQGTAPFTDIHHLITCGGRIIDSTTTNHHSINFKHLDRQKPGKPTPPELFFSPTLAGKRCLHQDARITTLGMDTSPTTLHH